MCLVTAAVPVDSIKSEPSESKACQEKGGGKEKSDGEKEGGCQEKGARQA